MRILVLRFSAMGDVALLTPLLVSLARKYAELSITLVTRKKYKPFFYNIPGIEVIGVDVDRDYRGLPGLFRMYRELKALGPYNAGIDLHGSTRSVLIKFFFRFSGLPFSTIDKGRREKRAQVRRRDKRLIPLPHTVERYAAAFNRAGLTIEWDEGPWINPDTISRSLAHKFLEKRVGGVRCGPWIGIAPFAGHQPKMWPLARMRRLIEIIGLEMPRATLFLFGGGRSERRDLETLRTLHDNAHVVADHLPLEGELALISRLDLMVAMDSLNMHLAALMGIRVLSIWGATHPYSGFGPFGQGEESIIQISTDRLACRPCSIFGSRPCFRRDHACMEWITPEDVYGRLRQLLPAPETFKHDSG